MGRVRVGKGSAIHRLAMAVLVEGEEEFTKYRADDIALAYSALTTMGRKRVSWSTNAMTAICQELEEALLPRPDEFDDDDFNEEFVRPHHDAYDALVAELKKFARYMATADSPQRNKEIQARIMALPTAAEKVERGEVYKH
jgi:hypothetical protein